MFDGKTFFFEPVKPDKRYDLMFLYKNKTYGCDDIYDLNISNSMIETITRCKEDIKLEVESGNRNEIMLKYYYTVRAGDVITKISENFDNHMFPNYYLCTLLKNGYVADLFDRDIVKYDPEIMNKVLENDKIIKKLLKESCLLLNSITAFNRDNRDIKSNTVKLYGKKDNIIPFKTLKEV